MAQVWLGALTRSSRPVGVVVAVTVLATAGAASGQRREGSRGTQVLKVQLPVAVKFGDVTVPGRTYRLTLASGKFALADPSTMLLVATVAAVETESAEVVAKPRVDVERRGGRIDIVMRAGNRIYRASGVTGEQKAPSAGTAVTLAKTERAIVGGGPEKRTAAQLVARATKRYAGGIKHCADSAHKARWVTDDPRFVRCVCPIVLRWKMPTVAAPLTMHWPLAKGRHGFSFDVTKDGKVVSCRVWAGAKPPPAPKPAPAPETAADETPPAAATSKESKAP